MKNKIFGIKLVLFDLGLVITASILFTLSHPNLLFINGLPFLAWIAYVPVLLLVRKNNLAACTVWGAVYGCINYAVFNYWLSAFHPIAGIGVYCIYLVYIGITFFFLKLADIFFPKHSYLVQWLIWLAYEFLRTKGFLGYSYGITGYSQWRMIPLIQIASITGVWGVSALVAFPSFWLTAAFNDGKITGGVKGIASSIISFFRKEKIPAILWALLLAASLVFGIMQNKDFSSYPAAQIALIQHNTDPWASNNAPTNWMKIESYRRDMTTLMRLSDEALASSPAPRLVVWPETAFIPRIYWHTTYREDQESWLLVRDLLAYLSSKNTPFLIGNDDGRRDASINPDPSEKYRIDYNAAMYFENGVLKESYRKLHLVPFTEHFPYRKQFPFIYNTLKKMDTHFWEKGKEATVFQGPGFAFSTPICFEDTFGYLGRIFVRRGADVLVNITNDAWSKSLPSQYQHLSMAVFRAVENSRPLVRSAASGQTCAVDPSGRVIAMAPAFKETWLNTAVPLVKNTTFYTKYGDYLAFFFVFTAVIFLLSGAVRCIMRKLKKG